MSYFMVDVETDGPIPGDYSMISVGCVLVEPGLSRVFQADIRPISARYSPEALAVSAKTREETLRGEDPLDVIQKFDTWLKSNGTGSPRFVSDNNGFDWMFVCWYFHHFIGRNPFGYSSTNLGSLYKGIVRSMNKNFKHLRRTAHTHDPSDDAIGNAEALLEMKENMGLEIDL
jgi:hypothetical protein